MKDLVNFSVPTSLPASGMIRFEGSSACPRSNAMMYSPLNASPRKMSRTEVLQILDEAIAVVTNGPAVRPASDSNDKGNTQ